MEGNSPTLTFINLKKSYNQRNGNEELNYEDKRNRNDNERTKKVRNRNGTETKKLQ